uniref:NADH-ubiquinone oxidoreductase chain 4 n=1 Tax=Philodromus sp. TaxID=2975155 RepID=A0A977Q6U3_9ARAC|nr:NADH dehydrogenase subunit 4 [Philodromus sp.]
MKKIITFMFMYMIIMMSLTSHKLMNKMFMMDKLSFIMLLLTMLSTSLILLSSSTFNKIKNMLIPIFIILMLTFTANNMFNFYILFELVLIPTFLLITMHGNQPERLQASIYLLIYTILASLPLLISIIYLKNPSFLLMTINMTKFNLIMFMMLAFLVKMPMYFMHLWLPKAHVEAPMEGSMILAAILLKLGGYGLIRLMPIFNKSINKINLWIISISLLGTCYTCLNCIQQKDMKELIAYSSVAHMGLVLTGVFSYLNMGMNGSIMMMFAHGLSSSALFMLVTNLYNKYHSRNIMNIKGLLTIMPNMTFWWFILMATNMSAPPSINTMSEILLMSNLIMWNMSSMIMIMIITLMTTSFSMLLFTNLIHNKPQMNFSKSTYHKIFLSLFIHTIMMMMMLFKMEIML